MGYIRTRPVFISQFIRSYEAALLGVFVGFSGGLNELPCCTDAFDSPRFTCDLKKREGRGVFDFMNSDDIFDSVSESKDKSVNHRKKEMEREVFAEHASYKASSTLADEDADDEFEDLDELVEFGENKEEDITKIEKVFSKLINLKAVGEREYLIEHPATFPDGSPITISLKIDNKGVCCVSDKTCAYLYMEKIYDLDSPDVISCISKIVDSYQLVDDLGISCDTVFVSKLPKIIIDLIACIQQLSNMSIFFDDP